MTFKLNILFISIYLNINLYIIYFNQLETGNEE